MSEYRRAALVTGAGRNIGRATVLALASQGLNVVVNARTNREEAERVAAEARALGSRRCPSWPTWPIRPPWTRWFAGTASWMSA